MASILRKIKNYMKWTLLTNKIINSINFCKCIILKKTSRVKTLHLYSAHCNSAFRIHKMFKFIIWIVNGKILLTVFWDAQHVYMTDYLEHRSTVTSERYTEDLKTSS